MLLYMILHAIEQHNVIGSLVVAAGRHQVVGSIEKTVKALAKLGVEESAVRLRCLLFRLAVLQQR